MNAAAAHFAKSSLAFRRLEGSDIGRVCEIVSLSENSSWTRAMFERELELPFSISSVAEEEDRVVGFAAAWAVADVAQLLEFAVDPACRRRGIGEALLRAVMAEARKRGCGRMELELRRENGPARSLYQRLGFVQVGERKRFYEGAPSSGDAILMEIPLK